MQTLILYASLRIFRTTTFSSAHCIVIINETQNSMDETRTAETNANSGSTQGERPVSKKMKTSDGENLVQVLRESIVMSVKDSKSLIQIDYLCFHF